VLRGGSVLAHTNYLSVMTLLCAAAHAQGPRLGLEYELEKDRRSGIRNHAATVEPGWEFAKGSPLDVVELLIDRNQDARADDEGFRARETKLFLRLRHKGSLTENSSYYLRGGFGRSFNNERNFNYAYVEPGLKYEFDDRWEWTLGARFGDAIDGTAGERIRKLITGPSYSFDKQNEIELRYIRARGDEDAWAVSVGYVRRF
jgi:hypothetical protein